MLQLLRQQGHHHRRRRDGQTDDDALVERLRPCVTSRSPTPLRHHEAGFNFRMTGYQAAMGRVQLRKIDFIVEQKRRVAHPTIGCSRR